MNNTLLLKLEAGALLIASLFTYHSLTYSWWLFACLILIPDIGLIGYLKNNKTGAFIYNIFHSKISPAILFGLGSLFSINILFPVSLIWFCHINFDRMVGIGLKETKGFKYTHLGMIGK